MNTQRTNEFLDPWEEFYEKQITQTDANAVTEPTAMFAASPDIVPSTENVPCSENGCDLTEMSSQHSIYVEHKLQHDEQMHHQSHEPSNTTSVTQHSHDQCQTQESQPHHEQSFSEHHTPEPSPHTNEPSIIESTNQCFQPAEIESDPIEHTSTHEIPSNDHFVPSSSQFGDDSEPSGDENDDQVRKAAIAYHCNWNTQNKQTKKEANLKLLSEGN